MQTAKTNVPRLSKIRWAKLRPHLVGWAFISPWLVSFGFLMVYPFIASFVLSFTRYQLIGSPEFIGFENIQRMLFEDPRVRDSLKVTFTYVLLTVPAGTAVSILVAILLNQKVRGIPFFRTSFYIPSVIGGVGLALLWTTILAKNGPVNTSLAWIGIEGPNWLFDTTWALPSLALKALATAGAAMLIILAALQGVPQYLYEAVELDGGAEWAKFRHVTLPQISPAIFYNVIVTTIGVMQSFVDAFIMTDGGPGTATLFYGLYLYRVAFGFFRMGYASALAWMIFLIILALTILNFRVARYWVYYEGEE